MTFLIIGYKGFIGNKIYNFLKNIDSYIVEGFSRNEELPNKKYDIILHCAGVTPSTVKYDFDYIENNIILTKKIIDKYPNSKIIFLSTKDIYGVPSVETISESTIPYKQSFYGMSKYLAERIIIENSDSYVIIRLPTVLGLNSPVTFITRILDNIVNGTDIVVYNGENFFNSVIHIDDIILVITFIINYKNKCNNEIYNIASDNYINIQDIPMIMSKNLNKELPNIINETTNNPSSLVSIDKIQKFLKLSDVETTIIKYINDIKGNKN